MEIMIDMDLLFQILGVLIVLISQARFVYKSRKESGSLKKAFFEMVSVVRVRENVKETPEEELKKTYPEWWALADYLSENIRDTAIGLMFTLVGLVFEGLKLTLTLTV
jgi:hypothetical protein